MDESFDLLSLFLIIFGGGIILLKLLGPKRPPQFSVQVNGITFVVSPGHWMFIPKQKFVEIEGQIMEIPEGGLFLIMSKEGKFMPHPKPKDLIFSENWPVAGEVAFDHFPVTGKRSCRYCQDYDPPCSCCKFD